MSGIPRGVDDRQALAHHLTTSGEAEPVLTHRPADARAMKRLRALVPVLICSALLAGCNDAAPPKIPLGTLGSSAAPTTTEPGDTDLAFAAAEEAYRAHAELTLNSAKTLPIQIS